MSAKNRDNKNRWRNITVGFRVSPIKCQAIMYKKYDIRMYN